eukprot:8906197-Pyramimonas_sp.AAC.1
MSRGSPRGSPHFRARSPANYRRSRRSDRSYVIRDKTLMASTKATTSSTKPRRRIRFDTRNVEHYPHIVSGKARLDKWKDMPNEGDIVK